MRIEANRFFGILGAAFAVLLLVALVDSGLFGVRGKQQANLIDTKEVSPEVAEVPASDVVSNTSKAGALASSTPEVVVESRAPNPVDTDEVGTPVADEPLVRGLSLGERDLMLALHNEARAAVGVAPLTWSSDIAASAEAWAGELGERSCVIAHSDTDQFGESLYFAMRTNGSVTPKEVVAAFAAEKRDYDPMTNTCAAGKECGHYTQMVWGDTTRMGCAKALCSVSGSSREAWVCQYGPRGNIRGERPYPLSN